MHTFMIVQESSGWKIQLGSAMSAPCKSQAMALEQAERMAEAIRRHGEKVVIIVDPSAIEAPLPQAAAAARIRAPRVVSGAK
jgi:hypothetical protein